MTGSVFIIKDLVKVLVFVNLSKFLFSEGLERDHWYDIGYVNLSSR